MEHKSMVHSLTVALVDHLMKAKLEMTLVLVIDTLNLLSL